jgi:undecaprenyl pyrophosphate synthase
MSNVVTFVCTRGNSKRRQELMRLGAYLTPDERQEYVGLKAITNMEFQSENVRRRYNELRVIARKFRKDRRKAIAKLGKLGKYMEP